MVMKQTFTKESIVLSEGNIEIWNGEKLIATTDTFLSKHVESIYIEKEVFIRGYFQSCLDKEMWKPLSGYEGIYEISDKGRVKSVVRKLRQGFRHELIRKLQITYDGYREVTLAKDKAKKHITIHRLVGYHFVENPNNYTELNHLDGNKLNICAYNLKWCTRKENINHAFEKGLNGGRFGKSIKVELSIPASVTIENNQVIEILWNE